MRSINLRFTYLLTYLLQTEGCLLVRFLSPAVHCLEKKHLVTFSSIFRWTMFRFIPNFQEMFGMNRLGLFDWRQT